MQYVVIVDVYSTLGFRMQRQTTFQQRQFIKTTMQQNDISRKNKIIRDNSNNNNTTVCSKILKRNNFEKVLSTKELIPKILTYTGMAPKSSNSKRRQTLE